MFAVVIPILLHETRFFSFFKYLHSNFKSNYCYCYYYYYYLFCQNTNCTLSSKTHSSLTFTNVHFPNHHYYRNDELPKTMYKVRNIIRLIVCSVLNVNNCQSDASQWLCTCFGCLCVGRCLMETCMNVWASWVTSKVNVGCLVSLLAVDFFPKVFSRNQVVRRVWCCEVINRSPWLLLKSRLVPSSIAVVVLGKEAIMRGFTPITGSFQRVTSRASSEIYCQCLLNDYDSTSPEVKVLDVLLSSSTLSRPRGTLCSFRLSRLTLNDRAVWRSCWRWGYALRIVAKWAPTLKVCFVCFRVV